MKPTPLITSNKTGYLLTNFLVQKKSLITLQMQKYIILNAKNMTSVIKMYDIYHE
jgi:hypothetical protein